MNIVQARIVFQAFFFGLFLFLAFVTQFSYLKGYPVSIFLEVDPLVAAATAIATHSLYRGLLWSLIVLLPTLLLGRFFCNWICPLGTLQQFIGWLIGPRSLQARIDRNRYRTTYALKYYVLAGMAAAALLGSLQIGLLDPISLLLRSFTVAFWPSLDLAGGRIFLQPHAYELSWLIGFLLVLFLALCAVIPRFFCRVLCPLGATLGLLSRFSWWRIERDAAKCLDCDLCLQSCEGACDPHSALRKSECFVCLNCIRDCPLGALSFRFLPSPAHEIAYPDLRRRHAVFAGLLGLIFYPLARSAGDVTKNFNETLVRPPGSVPEPEFLERCLKCSQCVRVCPTNVLQPALLEAGLEGVWTPLLNNRMGYCELNCVLCGQVCPTGAIERISLEQKLGIGRYEGRPVKLGTAFYDRGRCLPWAMDVPCVVCEEFVRLHPRRSLPGRWR